VRLRVPAGSNIAFDDLVRGHVEEDVGEGAGDFVLRRGDGVFAYQLVVAIDDAAMRISHVIRADDLLASTARQILLMKLLGYASVPTYAHIPLVVAPDGERLAKRTQVSTVRELAQQGISPAAVVGTLARGLGLVDLQGPLSVNDVARALQPATAWRKEPWPIPHLSAK
jgi:glutamyl-tRNA synthetase